MSNHPIPFKTFVLGSNSALPVKGKYPTAQLLLHNHRYFLLDCGEGTQFRLNEFDLPKSKISHIFITHMHGDHFFGLPGLLTSYKLSGRTKPLTIFSPPGLKDALLHFTDIAVENFGFAIEFTEIQEDEEKAIFEDDFIIVHTLKMEHRIPCIGFVFREKPGKRKIRKDKISDLNIPVDRFPLLQEGKDITLQDGTVLKNDDYTLPPPEPRSFAFFGDTKVNFEQTDAVKGIDLLYHEATFSSNETELAEERFHSTVKQAAEFAKKAAVKKLMIGHISTRHPFVENFLNEGKKVFEKTIYAEEGNWFEIGA